MYSGFWPSYLKTARAKQQHQRCQSHTMQAHQPRTCHSEAACDTKHAGATQQSASVMLLNTIHIDRYHSGAACTHRMQLKLPYSPSVIQ
jgi:hypothetical protein